MMQLALKYVYYALLLSGFAILLIRRKKLGSIVTFFLPLYFFNVVTQSANDLLMAHKVNTFPFYHVNQFIGALLLHGYYYTILEKRSYKNIVIAGFSCFALYFGYHFLYRFGNILTMDFSDFVVEGLFICIYVVLYLLELYRKDVIVILNKNPHFWISIGNLIFFSGCMFIMGFSNYLRGNNHALYARLVYINYFLNLLLYSLYIKAFLCKSETKKSS